MCAFVYDKTNKTGSDAKGYLFSGILADGTKGVENARNTAITYHFTIVKDGWNGSYYSLSGSQTFYTGATSDRAIKLPALTGWTTITDYKPIDLGFDLYIDSGPEEKRLYWASRNLGATTDFPAENSDAARQATYGGYYAWGETAIKSNYTWSTYFDTSDEGDSFTEYQAGGKEFLDPEDDAAHATIGSLWRMPTYVEFVSLVNYYTWTWDATNKGRKVTSTKAGYNDGRYIFLPAAGYKYDGAVNTSGTHGRYWTAKLNGSNSKKSGHIYFSSGDKGHDPYDRLYGLTIRPVTE